MEKIKPKQAERNETFRKDADLNHFLLIFSNKEKLWLKKVSLPKWNKIPQDV